MRSTRPISFIAAARKDLEAFPEGAQLDVRRELTFAAEGSLGPHSKPFKGVDGGVFEIALRFRGDAYRVVYAVKIAEAIWVVHAFQKKSRTGIKTPQVEIDLIRTRLARLKEMLK
jgi:phage-related protein